MKQLKRLAVTRCCFTDAAFVDSDRKLYLTEGDLSPLKSEKTIDFEFTYDSMVMGGQGPSDRS